MNSDVGAPRLGPAAAIVDFLDPSFLVLPATVRFPHPVVAHGELGMAAIVVYDGVALLDERTGKWFGPAETVDPQSLAAEAAIDLASAAKAPADRVTALVWLPSGLSGQASVPHEQIVASPDAAIVAQAIQELMSRRLTGSSEPTTPWVGAYAAAALGPKEKPASHFRRLLAAVELSLVKAIGEDPVVSYGYELTVADLVDPHFLFPALAVAASEDWGLATRKQVHGTGFKINLEADPSTLLGYRVVDIQPAIPFTALAPIVATARRCREGGEYCFDDIVRQFGRWLKKNNMDAAVLEDIEVRLATTG